MSKRNGKIARLPKQLRTLVNRSLDDGLSYNEIIAKLNDNAHLWPPGMDAFNPENIANWREGGYMEWTREQAVLDRIQAKSESAARLLHQIGGDESLHQAIFQVAASQLFEILTEFDLVALKDNLPADPTNYNRLLHAVARLNRGALDLEKFKDHVRQRKSRIEAELKKADPSGGLSPESKRVIESELHLL